MAKKEEAMVELEIETLARRLDRVGRDEEITRMHLSARGGSYMAGYIGVGRVARVKGKRRGMGKAHSPPRRPSYSSSPSLIRWSSMSILPI